MRLYGAICSNLYKKHMIQLLSCCKSVEKQWNHSNDISINGLYAEFQCKSNGLYTKLCILIIYRLRLCRQPLFLHIRLHLIWVLGWFVIQHWIRGTIWLRIAYLKSRIAWFWDFSVFGILSMVSGSLVLHFDTKFRSLLCFEASKRRAMQNHPIWWWNFV